MVPSERQIGEIKKKITIFLLLLKIGLYICNRKVFCIDRNTFYTSWEEYSASKNLDSKWGFADETVYVHALEEGTNISSQYLDRKVNFTVVNHEGENHLKVVSCENSSLKAGDLLFVYRIRKGEILEVEKVIRGNMIGNYKTHGEVMSIEISES